MRFQLFTIAAIATTVIGQDLSQLPKCATACVGNSLTSGTGCSSLNVTCICLSSGWIANLACCVSKGCNQADTDTTIKFAQQICGGVGVNNLPATAGCSNSTTAANGTTTTSKTSSTALRTGTAASPTSTAAAPTGQMLGFGAGIAAAAGLLAAAL